MKADWEFIFIGIGLLTAGFMLVLTVHDNPEIGPIWMPVIAGCAFIILAFLNPASHHGILPFDPPV